MPALRDRVDDIATLSDHFLSQGAQGGPDGHHLSDAATEVLRRYSWPGNVRQLENTIRRLVVTAGDADK